MSNGDNDVYQKDIRKSKFVQTTESEAADTFDLVRNGQNLKISQPDLITSLGFTGSIEAKGEVEAIPVLDVQGSINYIRGIIGGSGIISSLSPGDAVEVAHNFIANSEHVPVMINETADQPTIRSIEAGTGITVGGAGGVIQIAVSGEPPTSTKTIQVFSIDDFPDPVGGVITLEDETIYLIQNDVSSANRYVMGDKTVIEGANSMVITLEYTGSGIMITALDVESKVQDITISAPSGTAFDISSTTGNHQGILRDSNVKALNFGNFDNLAALILSFLECDLTGNGITFTGNFSICLLTTILIRIPSGTGDGLDLGTATFDQFQLINGFAYIDTTGYTLVGLPDSGNINADGLGVVQQSRQYGTAVPMDGITPFDELWEMTNNSQVPNSVNLALSTHDGATIDIVTQNVPVIIGATWIEETMYRFTATAGGRWTYDGKIAQVNLGVSISGQRAASGTDDYGFYFYLNGVQITESLVVREFTNSSGNATLIWSVLLDTDDYIEVFVENQTGTTDFQVDNITARFS